jgi:transposase
VAERTRAVSRLRWRLHELDPELDPTPRSLDRASSYDKLAARLDRFDGVVARLARREFARCRELTVEIDQLEAEISRLVTDLAPSLLAIVGCGPLNAAKIVGECAGATRFRSANAFARHNGTAPLPVWSSNHQRHRLSCTGNRQLNAALYRIALTQIRMHPPAKELYRRRRPDGDGGMEALRVVKRRLSDVVFRALLEDHGRPRTPAA